MSEAYPKIYLYKRIVQAKLFIDQHFAEPIALDHIADEACFSKFHFVRQFKKIYGKTPHQYLITVRIKKAVELLNAGDSVSDSCFKVGFESLSSFSGLFRELMGIPPSVYFTRQRALRTLKQNNPLAFIPGCHALENHPLSKAQF